MKILRKTEVGSSRTPPYVYDLGRRNSNDNYQLAFKPLIYLNIFIVVKCAL